MNHRSILRVAASAVAAAALLMTGCAEMSPRQQGTAQGAGIGAVAGAVIGAATGGKAGPGAVIGGALGAVAGNVWSKRQEDRRVRGCFGRVRIGRLCGCGDDSAGRV